MDDEIAGAPDGRRARAVRRALRGRSYCTIATASIAHRPHVSGVLYALVDQHFFVTTLTTSVKARNIRENARVAVCIPVRRYPVGPPFSIQFQGTAELLGVTDSVVTRALARGALKRITSHGELDHPDTCFVRIACPRRMAVYGLGAGLADLLRDPIAASYSIDVSWLGAAR